jgi:alkylation response protein AidB-like acyl-CoA dehydrogenase
MSHSVDRADNSRLIQESASFVTSPDRLRSIRAARYQLPGFDRDEWQNFATLGWTSLRLPEMRGGPGFGVSELCALAEQLGAGLSSEPLIAAIATAPLLPHGWSARVALGEIIVLPAWQEYRGIPTGPPRTRFSNGRLNGEKRYVPMAAGADAFLVTTDDGLALVERQADGLTLSTDVLQDGGHLASLGFVDTPAVAIEGDFASVCEEITLATAAYLLGMMRRAFTITADYLTTREQFGKPIGSFQSLQHRMVDLHIQIELTRASVWKAGLALDDAVDIKTARLAVSRAKARASDAAMLVTRQAIQLHGGMGFTDEADIGLFLRKAMVFAYLHGSATQHRARFAQLLRQGDEA